MFLPCWLTSVRSLFASRRARTARDAAARRMRRDAAAERVERLEARQVMAFDFVSASPNVGAFLTDGTTLDQAPQQIAIKFSPGSKVDPQSLATGIVVTRSGNGLLGDGDDPVVMPGSITVDDFPNQNVVIVRFAESLPDDRYRIAISGAGAGGLRTLSQGTGIPSERFRSGGSFTLDFRLDLGAQVTSVVPQPFARPKIIDFGADMTQYRDGDLLSIAIRGGKLTFEFDADGKVAAGNRALTLASKKASDLAAEVAAALPSSGVFGTELSSANLPQPTRINLRGTTFSPIVSFTRAGAVPAVSPVTINDGAVLTQAADKVVVYFNANDPILPASAQSPRNYRLVETDPSLGTDVAVQVPMSVSYDAVSATAVLTFEPGKLAADKLYRLRVGDSTDVNNRLDSAVWLGSLFSGSPFATNAFLGEGADSVNDVDLYRVALTAAGTISATVAASPGSTFVPYLRLFDAFGTEVASSASGTLSKDVAAAGDYYLGVSSTGNTAYDAVTGANAAGGTTRGGYALTLGSNVAVSASDENSSFATATTLGTLGAAARIVSGQIDVRPSIATPSGTLLFPTQPGTIDEPGHRDLPVGGESHLGAESRVGTAAAIPVQYYNFQSLYGVDPQGNQLFNAITEEQKQRAREIFNLYGLKAGIRFVESPDSGLTVVTGDIRAVAPNASPTAVAGICGGGLVVMNSTIDFGKSEYNGYWQGVAFHEIGHAIGLGHAYDIPSVMGAGESGAQLAGDTVLPYPYDVAHVNVLYPRNGSDIDVYRFALDTAGTLSAQTVVARPGQPVRSMLDTVLTLYREENGVRTLVARNDDYYGTDSFLGLDLDPGLYYLAVTSTGNTAFNPEVADSGYGGRSDGAYELRLDFTPVSASTNTIVDAAGTALDGDRDGKAGGAFEFWFTTASAAATLMVDKAAAAVGTWTAGSALVTSVNTAGLAVGRRVIGDGIPVGAVVQSIVDATSFRLSANATLTRVANAIGLGTIAAPYRTIGAALSAVTAATRIIRILGNSGNEATLADEKPYLVGTTLAGAVLADGASFNVPKGVTVMIDASASIKLRAAVIDVGSSSGLVSRAGAAIQILGTPTQKVQFTSYHDDSIGGDSDGVGPAVQGGQWGGIVLRRDSDSATKKVFLNSISQATLRYGGGNVVVDSQLQPFAPIHLETTRPTLAFNDILFSAGAGISADPNSFEDSGNRFGPEVRGNRLLGNTINGLFVRIRTALGATVDKLDVPARFKSTDITYVIQENLVIAGGVGGYFVDPSTGQTVARSAGRLTIDPGTVVKLMGARIELERGNAQLIAEGTPQQHVIVTSLGDNRFGAGGTFDTNGNSPDVRAPGDWSGIVVLDGSKASIDHAYVAYGGGQSAIEGGFDRFDTIEVHQGVLRVADSRIEFNASGRSTGDRNARGTNDDSTIFVRGAAPVIVGNDFRDNSGATISVNANSFTNVAVSDPGRSTGLVSRFTQYDDNVGPLLRANAISNKINYAADRQKGAFDISFQFDVGVTQAVKDAIEAAADRWETVITGALTPVRDGAKLIRGIEVRVQAGLLGTSPSDGTGSVLANAKPTAFRDATDANKFLPYKADVGVDMSDATSPQLVAILTHELGHALGFTTVAGTLNLTSGGQYRGAAALAEYRATFDPKATYVPLETGGGAGTAYAHWEEATFQSELLTGTIDPGINPLTRLSIAAFQDMGYSVNFTAADDYLPKSGTVGYVQPTSGVVVRGEQILVDSVWDDTDLVHVVTSEITVDNFHTATSLRLESQSNASLVVKLAGPSAGFTATGTASSIDDRIGGTVHVIGQPGYPVVLTSVYDDSVGASLDPLGRTVTDTNNDGRAWIDATATAPLTAAWRSLKFLPLSNDTNVAIQREAELPYTNRTDVNADTQSAQVLGVLAPNFATGTATSASAQNKAGDENRRDGFTVRGSIAVDSPGDVDVYSFSGYAGSEVWFDIDKTSAALDTMLELTDADGNVLARSLDGQFDTATVSQRTVPGSTAGTTQVHPLGRRNILPGTLSGAIYLGNTIVQTYTVNRAGTFTFTSVGSPPVSVTAATLDRDTGIVTLSWSESVAAGASRLVADYAYGRLSLATLGFAADGSGGSLPLEKDAYRGNDYFTTNPRDAGMRVILPGVQGSLNHYFLRVRSQPYVDPTVSPAEYEADAVDPGRLASGATSGAYELSVRLQQRDQVPGSAVVYADIRYATTGIDVQGLPRNSLLTGTIGQQSGGGNDQFRYAQDIGKLLQSDQNTLSLAGSLNGASDVRWFKFSVDYTGIQAIPGLNGGGKTWSTVLDIDYADGFRGDLSMAVFDSLGRLVFLGRDSNVAADQPGPGQGSDFPDLSRGSAGKLDPYIGAVQLPAGATAATPTEYFVAIMSNATLPDVLDATFKSGATNALVRLEPVDSVRRIVEDHVGSTGYVSYPANPLSTGTPVLPEQGQLLNVVDPSFGGSKALSSNVRAFNLADVPLYVSNGNSIYVADALRGKATYQLSGGYGGGSIGDLDMRTDGSLFQAFGKAGDTGNVGFLREISAADGGIVSEVGDAVPDVPATPADTDWWKLTSDTVDALAIGRTDVAKYEDSVFYSLRSGTKSFLFWGRTNGDAHQDDNAPTFSKKGEIKGTGITGRTTGLQFRNENFGTLYGVSTGGQFYTVSPFSGAATLVADFSARLTALGATGFQGLATAPVNLEGGRYQGMFFAITDTGRLVCISPNSTGSSAKLLENVFDNDANGVPESAFSNAIVGGATGLAFSPMDVNLWHPTTSRGGDAGHGINEAPDNSRKAVDGGTSMYFGLEEFGGGYANFNGDAPNQQFGVASYAAYNWQQDLTANPAIGNNYNVPGGTQGSLVTNSFSLAGYAPTDKPTLYVNYFLDTQGASGNKDANTMRDSARVLVSVDNGLTWELLATNNSTRSTIDSTDAELPNTLSASSAAGTADNQSVQELFDSTGSWRQARIDLAKWAGKTNIQLRFDFATAGMMDSAALRTTPDEIRTVSAATTTATVTLDSVSGLRVGMAVTGPGIVGEPTILSIDSATEVTLTRTVTLASGDALSFFDKNNRKLNTIGGVAGSVGNLNSAERAQGNAFEGFYLDDLIVGFAERGEMVTGAGTGQTATFSVATPSSQTYPQQSLQGAYQLEIRRGTEYAVQGNPAQKNIAVIGPIDTNDSLVQAPSAPAKVLEENVVDAAGGPLATSGTGTVVWPTSAQLAALGIDPPAGATFPVLAAASKTRTSSNLLSWAVNLAGEPAATLEFQYLTLPGEDTRPLPSTFATPTVAGTRVLPAGDGVAISVDGGTTWRTLAGLGNTQGSWSRVRLDLTTVLTAANLTLTADTVIGFFQSGNRPIDLLDLAASGGIAVDDFRITADPPVVNTETIGDQNHPRTQGQFVIANNIITSAADVAISITAGARDSDSGAPNPGTVRNLAVLNNAALVPGVVAMNNVVANAGRTGILFAGSPVVFGSPDAPVPFGRFINNTIWGGSANGTGIEVRDNAAPTILNNLFANLARGVAVDATSGGTRTVVGASAYWQVGQAVTGAQESSPIALSGNPFVNAAGGNFYLVAGSEAIDSSVNTLQDRAEFTVVKSPMGIQQSPIVAPDRDLHGQLRVDNPWQASAPGLGSNVFKDRGAIDRVDFSQPRIAIVSPVDNRLDAPIDRDDSPDAIRLERGDAGGITQFVLQVGDDGVGIDKSSVVSAAFQVRVDVGDGAPRLLQPGVDYLFRYLQNTNRVIFESIAAFPLGTYTITAVSKVAAAGVAGQLIDLANNTLLPNKADGSTSFQVALVDIPTKPLAVVGTRGDAEVTLAWQAPASAGGTAIIDYLVQVSSDAGATWTSFDDGVSAATSATVTGLTNGVSYVFRVQGRNVVNAGGPIDDGNWSDASLPVKPLAPAAAPENLVANGGNAQATLSWTAPSATGGSAISDYLVQYSTDGGTTWTKFSHLPSVATSITVTNLANGVAHVFRVAAVTEYGPGLPSDVSLVVIPMTVPDAPTGLTATLGNTVVDLTWNEGFNGGSTVVNHVIQYRVSGSGVWQNFDPPSAVTGSSVRVTGLVNGTSYRFRVASTNAAGDSGWSNLAGPVIPVAPASEPLSFKATGGNAQATLTWVTPADNGGSAITDYQVQSSVDGGSTWAFVADAVSTATTTTLLDLSNGTTYVFRVAAVTLYGLGAWSTPSSPVTPMTVATAPSGLTGVRGDAKVDLTWTAPSDNGGAAITDYLIEYSPAAGGAWVAFPHAASAATSASVTGLVNGSSYQFRVSAINAAGTSALSNVTGPHTPMAPASAPQNLTGAFGDTKVTLAWTAPASNGGGTITDYLVEYRSSAAGALWTVFPHAPSTATGIVVTGLVNGTGYTFRVSAVNPVGSGATAVVGPIIPMTLPGAPAILTAVPGDSKVDLTWRAPASDGGGTITNYIVEYKIDSPTAAWTRYPRAASTALAATVGQLVNGTTYVFRVSALNPAGTGPASAVSPSVMPVTVPDAPLSVTAVGGDKKATLTWTTPPRDGGLPITDYVVEFRRLKDAFWTVFNDGVSTATRTTVTGLLNGANYAFRVRAKSGAGEGASSAESNYITVRGLAAAPSAPVAVAGDGTVNLTWTEPLDNGGAPITDYLVEYRKSTETAWTTFADGTSAAVSATVTGLSTATNYLFRVSAINVVGTGAASPVSNVVTFVASPSEPLGLKGTAGDKSVALKWSAPATSNGSPVTDYVVEYRKSTDAAWTVFADGTSALTSTTVTGLVNGTPYVFQVRAVNAIGTSVASAESAALTPLGLSAAPTAVTGVGTRGTVTLTWTPPSDTGGLPITGYVVQYRLNNATAPWVTAKWPAGVSPTATSVTILGFRTRFGHVFRVAAKTALGQGAWSEVSAAVNPFAV